MDEQVINRITTHSGISYYVGQIFYGNEGRYVIERIENDSRTYDNRIEFIFNIYSAEKMMARIINCPVIIDYK